MSTSRDIERLHLRAAYYRGEAARAQKRARLIYCRALATHLEREAVELERVIKRDPPSRSESTEIPQPLSKG